MVSEGQTVMGRITQVYVNPLQLIRPGGGIFPRRGRDNVSLKIFTQVMKGFYSSRYGFHFGVDPGNLVELARVD